MQWGVSQNDSLPVILDVDASPIPDDDANPAADAWHRHSVAPPQLGVVDQDLIVSLLGGKGRRRCWLVREDRPVLSDLTDRLLHRLTATPGSSQCLDPLGHRVVLHLGLPLRDRMLQAQDHPGLITRIQGSSAAGVAELVQISRREHLGPTRTADADTHPVAVLTGHPGVDSIRVLGAVQLILVPRPRLVLGLLTGVSITAHQGVHPRWVDLQEVGSAASRAAGGDHTLRRPGVTSLHGLGSVGEGQSGADVLAVDGLHAPRVFVYRVQPDRRTPLSMNISQNAVAAREAARSKTGEFGHQQHTEPGITLHRADPVVNVGGNSPWGQIDEIDPVADGITRVYTSSHGGYKLDAERNSQVHPAWRQRSGWYEEDCEQHIVAYTFGDEMGLSDEHQENAVEGVKNWYPDEYTEVTGQQVSPEESSALRRRIKDSNEREWREMNREKFIVESATYGGMLLETPGWTEGKAVRAADGEERFYLYPNGSGQGQTPYLIDEVGQTTIDITDIRTELSQARAKITDDETRREAGEPAYDLGTDQGTITASQRKSLDKDLDKRWRFTTPDGERKAMSLREYVAEHGVTGASEVVREDNVRRSYQLHLAGGGVIPVSKATWYKSASVPNLTTSYGRDYNEVLIAHNKLSRARSMDTFGQGMEGHHKRREAIAAAEAEIEVARQKTQPVQERCRSERARLNAEASAKALARIAEQTA